MCKYDIQCYFKSIHTYELVASFISPMPSLTQSYPCAIPSPISLLSNLNYGSIYISNLYHSILLPCSASWPSFPSLCFPYGSLSLYIMAPSFISYSSAISQRPVLSNLIKLVYRIVVLCVLQSTNNHFKTHNSLELESMISTSTSTAVVNCYSDIVNE